MAKQLNTYQINLAMTADTSQAKRQLQDLQTQLSNLMNSTASSGANNLGITKQITNATQAVAQLKVQLENATNVDTGKLDLGKFQQSLKESGMTLKDYQTTLSSLGPAGTQAFATLATSITQAEIPLRRSNELLSSLWTTMKNTARWQLTSSMLHGFQGALQTAFGYAKDLNSSLNNIRIVTGYGVDEMAQFAVEANKAAKALSTTTTEYTDAALIYYQQGLNDEQVLARTDATIKLANVSRQSAEEVSQQLTAIWNNFSDGTDNLEYYIDVITKLGATTASSSQEISDGLQKFAAVSSTVGLSYEYAAAALATVTATTRQSADVVGTAFRTLFARIEQLNLGEILDDGTTLGKYSEALMKVGVNIKDANGELKDMDDILDEIGAKWATLGRDEQVALAQSVAGIRQYTQFIALMDNWDFMEKNVETARNSTGELQRQADIYAESWEAARDRITASAEAIYDALLNDEFFIELNNLGADVLDTINNIIKGVGGLKGVLTLLSGTMIMLFQDNLAKGLKDLQYNFMMLTNSGRQQVEKLRTEANQLLIQSVMNTRGTGGQAIGQAYKDQANLQQAYIKNAEKMTQEQQKIAQSLLEQQQYLITNLQLSQEQLENEENQLVVDERKLKALINNSDASRTDKQIIKEQVEGYKEIIQLRSRIDTFVNEDLGYNVTKDNIAQFTEAVNKAKLEAQDFATVYGEKASVAYERFNTALNNNAPAEAARQLQLLWNEMLKGSPEVDLLDKEFEEYIQTLGEGTVAQKQFQEFLQKLAQDAENTGRSIQRLNQQSQNISNFTNEVSQAMERLAQQNTSTMDSVIALAGALTTFVSVINIVSGTIKTVTDDSLSSGEKLLSIIGSLGMAIPMLARVLNTTNLAHLLNILGVSGATAEMGFAKLLITLGPFALKALAVTGAIAAVIAIFNKDADAAKKAKKEHEELTSILEENKTAYQELLDTIQDYHEAQKGLDNLTGSAEEFGKAVREANNQVIDLIRKYPSLAKYVTNTNGRLTISDEGLATVQEEQYQEVQQSNRNALLSDLKDKQAALKSERTTLGRSLGLMGGGTGLQMIMSAYQQDAGIFGLSATEFANRFGLEEQIAKQVLDRHQEIETLIAEFENQDAYKGIIGEQLVASYLAEDNLGYATASGDQQQALAKKIAEAIDGDLTEENIKEAISKNADNFLQEIQSASIKKTSEKVVFDYNAALEQQAEQLEISSQALDGYADALAEAHDGLEADTELSLAAATANIRFSKGVDNLRKAFEEHNEVLERGESQSIEYYEALGAIAEAASETFGVQLGTSFVEDYEDQLRRLAEGDGGVINELGAAAAKCFIDGLDIEGPIQEQLNHIIDDLSQQDIAIGLTTDTTEAINGLNELLASGQLTAEQLEQTLGAIGYKPNLKYKEEYQETPITTDVYGNFFGKDIQLASLTTHTKSLVRIPYIEPSVGGESSGSASGSFSRISTGATRARAFSSNVANGGPIGQSSSGSSNQLDKKRAEEEIERYHQLNKELKQLETEYSRIGKLKDEAYGANKLKYINQEISKIQQLQSKQSQLGNAIFSNVVQDYANIKGYGFEINNETGTITNYAEVYAKQIEIFNNQLTDEAEANFENFVKLTKQYEDSLDLYNENYDKQVELFYQELQAKLEKITVRVEAAIEINDDSIKLIDYYTKRLEDNSFAVADALVFMGDKARYLTDNAIQYQQGIADIEAQIEEQGMKATEAQIEQLRKYRDELLNTNLELAELTKTINEQFIVALDESNEEIEKSLKRFDNYGNVLKKYGDILKLLGKDAQNMGIQQQLAAAATANAINKLDVSRQQYDLLEEAYRQGYAEYQKALDEGNQDVINTWENNVDKLAEEVQNAYSKVLDNEVNALQAAADEFKTGVEETIKTLQRTMSEGYDTLDQLQTVYDRQKMLNDEYITENQQVHELNKLARDVDKAITDNPNLNAQKRLRDFMDDINDTYAEIGENGEYITRMSQYDLDYARKRYELLLAQIALEDARNNKTSMRLVRDSSGNYNYIYTADQNETDNTEQQYEDKLYELQKISEDRIKATSDAILQNRKNMIKAMEELNADDFASQEEYIAALESIKDDYLEHEKFLEGELSKSMNNLQNDNGTLTETIITNTIGVKNETDALEVAANEAIGKLGEHWGTFRDNVDAAVNASGGIGAEGIIPNIQSISKESDDLVKHFDEDTLPKVKKYLKDTLDAIDNWNKEWSAKTKETIGYNEKVAESINALVPTLENVVPPIESNFDKIAEAAKGVAAAAQEAAQAISNLNGTKVSGYVPSDADNEGQIQQPITNRYSGRATFDGGDESLQLDYGNASVVVQGTDVKSKVAGATTNNFLNNARTKEVINTQTKKRQTMYYSEQVQSWITAEQAAALGVSYDTGGYTGQWGPAGKFAMLHEKELVLNSHDTENMLSAVQVLRSLVPDISSGLTSAALSQQGILGSIMHTAGVSPSNNTLQQMVTIDANFPGVTSAAEIESALNDIVNQAAQYASIKKLN